MKLNMMKTVKLNINEIKSMRQIILSKSLFALNCVRFTAKIQEYSNIAKIIGHWTPVIHDSILLNPRLGGAFVDPYTFHAIKDIVINKPILPGTLRNNKIS